MSARAILRQALFGHAEGTTWIATARILFLLAVLPLVGAVGFYFIEGWSFFDSLYMAVITLTTVGFQEVHPLSTGGRAFVMIYLALGIGTFSFSVVRLGEMVVRLELHQRMERRRMDATIKNLSAHVIICGFGRMGLALSRQLASKSMPFLVVDRDEARLEECRRNGWLYVVGDATEDWLLTEVGIDRARGLAAVLSSDADNLFVVLSARLLAKDVLIIARATEEATVPKLRKAGADQVIPLFETGAQKMARLLTNPDLVELLEVFQAEGAELEVAEIQINPEMPWCGKRLDQTNFRSIGINIVGIRRTAGELLVPPPITIILEPGDRLIALGSSEAISQIARR